MNDSMFRVVGIVFIVAGFFIDDIVDNLTVVNEVEVVQLGLSQPSDEISKEVSRINEIVTDDDDQLALAIFNKVAADRIQHWPDFDQQQFNNAYVSAAKKFFGDSMKNKYEELDRFLLSAIMEITGDDIHKLSVSERAKLVDKLYGVSYHLLK